MEQMLIDWLREQLHDHPRVLLGVGDDAAVLKLQHQAHCVVTTDLLTDGVDFRLPHDDAARVGRKALAVNLSDLAAMAARPVSAVVSLALPRQGAQALAMQLYRGILPLADEFDIPIAGGDTNTWDGPLAISVTAIGETSEQGALLRSGARAGDAVVVTGAFGGSILDKQFTFTPRVREALAWHARYELHAATDVSDGLSLDLSHIMQASGCGAELLLADIPISDAAQVVAAESGRMAWEHGLTDGEDFELVLAVPEACVDELLTDASYPVTRTRIGTFIEDPRLWIVAPDGSRQVFTPRGYEH